MSTIHAPIRLLQLDPSYEATGYAVLDGAANILQHGVFRCVNECGSQERRANEVAYRIGQFVRDKGTGFFTHFGREIPAGRNSGSFDVLERLGGAISHALWLARPDIECQKMEVREWRKAIEFQAPKRKRGDKTANAKLKAALLAFAQERWPGMKFATADEAEAALMGMRYLMAIHGSLPFELKRRTTKRAPASSETSAPSSPSSGASDSSGSRSS